MKQHIRTLERLRPSRPQHVTSARKRGEWRARRAVAELDVPTHGFDDAVEAAEASGLVVVEAGERSDIDRLWVAGLFDAEHRVAEEIRRRVDSASGRPPSEAELDAATHTLSVALRARGAGEGGEDDAASKFKLLSVAACPIEDEGNL